MTRYRSSNLARRFRRLLSDNKIPNCALLSHILQSTRSYIFFKLEILKTGNRSFPLYNYSCFMTRCFLTFFFRVILLFLSKFFTKKLFWKFLKLIFLCLKARIYFELKKFSLNMMKNALHLPFNYFRIGYNFMSVQFWKKKKTLTRFVYFKIMWTWIYFS